MSRPSGSVDLGMRVSRHFLCSRQRVVRSSARRHSIRHLCWSRHVHQSSIRQSMACRSIGRCPSRQRQSGPRSSSVRRWSPREVARHQQEGLASTEVDADLRPPRLGPEGVGGDPVPSPRRFRRARCARGSTNGATAQPAKVLGEEAGVGRDRSLELGADVAVRPRPSGRSRGARRRAGSPSGSRARARGRSSWRRPRSGRGPWRRATRRGPSRRAAAASRSRRWRRWRRRRREASMKRSEVLSFCHAPGSQPFTETSVSPYAWK